MFTEVSQKQVKTGSLNICPGFSRTLSDWQWNQTVYDWKFVCLHTGTCSLEGGSSL